MAYTTCIESVALYNCASMHTFCRCEDQIAVPWVCQSQERMRQSKLSCKVSFIVNFLNLEVLLKFTLKLFLFEEDSVTDGSSILACILNMYWVYLCNYTVSLQQHGIPLVILEVYHMAVCGTQSLFPVYLADEIPGTIRHMRWETQVTLQRSKIHKPCTYIAHALVEMETTMYTTYVSEEGH